MEQWKDIIGYEGLYQISNLGNVKSFYNRKVLKNGDNLSKLNRLGYLNVNLTKLGKLKGYRIHRLVAQHFIKNPENKKEVNHIDGNKHNNTIENLEWCTRSENEKHAYTVLGIKPPMLGKKGALHPTTKKIARFSKDLEFIDYFNGANEANRILGISKSSINDNCRGTRKTAGGFIWKFV